MPGLISLGVYPGGRGFIDIDPPMSDYALGEKFTFTAIPYSGRKFFKWGGTIDLSTPSFEYTVTKKDQDFYAYFPLEVYNDSTVFLGEYPVSTMLVGEYANFNFALDLPLDSTYTLCCTCNEYDNFSFALNCSGDMMNINAGCLNNKQTVQDTWHVVINSNKTNANVADFTINYRVEWK